MQIFVHIALVVFLGTVAVQGYGPKIHRKKHGGPHKSSEWPSHGPPHGPPLHHRPAAHDNSFGPPFSRGHWDDSPVWNDRSDSRDSSEDSGSFGPDHYSSERDSSDHSGPSYEDYGHRFDHHHLKHTCKPPHNKEPPKTTPKHVKTTPKPIPPSPKPKPPTPKPIPTKRPDPTTPQIIPRPPITTASRPTWETTTNSVPETTTAEGEELTTITPEIEECIANCPSTPEYNPVCGSNGVTYNNQGKLFCASSCGVNVTLVRRSACPPPGWDNDDGETFPPTTTTPFRGRTTSLTDFQRCMRLCRITTSFTPVCGTDLVTYMNMDRLKCAQSCGEVIEVLCEKPCAACGFNPGTPKTTTLRPSTTPQIGRTTPQIGTTTPEPDVQECIKACPVTSEYNPVCGSDHFTYSNPSKLVCAQLCGVGVTIARLGPCGPATTSSTTTVAPLPTLSPDVLSCIRRCPVTSEYDPVCGSDRLTYNNLGNLRCSKYCGVEVDFKHKSRCVDEFDLDSDGTDSTTSQTTQAITGNKDQVTTPSRSTATTTSLFTSPTIKSTATPTMTPATTPTSTTNAGPNTSSTVGFTIPIDVLIDIFGSTTTQAPTSKAKNPDEDEDLDIDNRFNIETDTNKDTGRGHYSKIIFPD